MGIIVSHQLLQEEQSRVDLNSRRDWDAAAMAFQPTEWTSPDGYCDKSVVGSPRRTYLKFSQWFRAISPRATSWQHPKMKAPESNHTCSTWTRGCLPIFLCPLPFTFLLLSICLFVYFGFKTNCLACKVMDLVVVCSYLYVIILYSYLPTSLVPSPATTLLQCCIYSITVSFSLTPIPFFSRPTD